MYFKKHLWAILYTLMLIGFTTYILLNTFVIEDEYAKIEANMEDEYANLFAEYETLPGWNDEPITQPATEGATQGNTQVPTEGATQESTQTPTENTTQQTTEATLQPKITLTEYRRNDTTIYVADVRIPSLAYLRCAFANDTYGKNITAKTSVMASTKNAMLAINGDYYGARDKGYVIRNGILYRDSAGTDREDLVIYKNGSFGIINESEVTAKELLDAGAMHVFSFGPALMDAGAIMVDENDEVGQSMSSNPRTAIAIIEEGHYLFIVSDGRTNESEGLSLYELATFCKELGAVCAYNLDGGGSSTMYYNGEVVNNPTTNGKTIKERSVSDIVYISY